MGDLYRYEADNIYRQPVRSVTRVDADSLILSMPAYSPRLQRFAVKIVTEFKNNPSKYSLPVQGGLILLIDGRDSSILATLDAPMITAIRTGAVSGLATELLSRRDSKNVGVIGSGQQARTQLEAICAAREISKVSVYSRNKSNAAQFAREMSNELGVDVEAKDDRKRALANMDIVILATNSFVPVMNWSEVSQGCHINSIGTLPDRTEVDIDTVCNSRLFVDNRSAVPLEAGDVIGALRSGRIADSHMIGDLSDLILNKVSGRTNDTEVTLFKSVGFALQDVYASSYVYDQLAG